MGSEVLGQVITTSLSVIPAGLYFLLMVEPVEGIKGYRYRFLPEGDTLEAVNNVVTVGLVGYLVFVLSVPFVDWIIGTVFGSTVSRAVVSMSVPLQLATITVLAILNISMAYLGLQKG